MTIDQETPTLDQEAATLLTEFARACKAAARAVTLYPPSHPAIHISLSRLVDTAGRLTASGPATFGILPNNLLLGGRSAAKPDQAVRETGALLHDHMIGILTMYSSPGPEGWLPFLLLVARPAEEVRTAGGVSRVWAATGQRYLDIQEIDYADILRDRGAGLESRWDDIIRACLNLDSPLDDEALRHLIETCGSAERFSEFIVALEQEGPGGTASKATALLRMLHGVVNLVSKSDPSELEPLLKNIAQGLGNLSPELMMELLSHEKDRADAAADLVLRIATRMTDQTLSSFVARGVIAEGGASTRLAQAFQALVPDKERRHALLQSAQDEVQQSPLGSSEDFLDLWKNAADMLTSYSDEAYVSESYARELSGARTQALEVERVSDDPPERIGGWITSVGPTEIRSLDLQLLLDLLTIENDLERWTNVTAPAVTHIEDLLLVGDFDGAVRLVQALSNEVAQETPRKAAAARALQQLVEGTMMTHIATHMRTVDEPSVEQIKTLCYAVGPSMVKPLAEVLSVEKRVNARQRLTQLLIGFGAAGRQSVEQLKGSVNPAVRRTAIYLLREFGGSEALPDLTALLGDAEPHIQREAVRAILMIGTDDAYEELQKALMTGTDKTRETLMAALVAMRNERAIPLFEYIVRKIDRKGPLRAVYLHAIESLGALKAGQSVDLLKDALFAGEWWAPFRTAELRRTSAIALRHIGTPDALRVLEEAAESGPRGVRNAIKAARA